MCCLEKYRSGFPKRLAIASKMIELCFFLVKNVFAKPLDYFFSDSAYNPRTWTSLEITPGLIDVHFLLVVEGTSQIFPLHVYVLLQHVNMCSRLSANKVLIQSLIWCCDDIITHCDDWSLYYNAINYNIIWMIDQHFIST